MLVHVHFIGITLSVVQETMILLGAKLFLYVSIVQLCAVHSLGCCRSPNNLDPYGFSVGKPECRLPRANKDVFCGGHSKPSVDPCDYVCKDGTNL